MPGAAGLAPTALVMVLSSLSDPAAASETQRAGWWAEGVVEAVESRKELAALRPAAAATADGEETLAGPTSEAGALFAKAVRTGISPEPKKESTSEGAEALARLRGYAERSFV